MEISFTTFCVILGFFDSMYMQCFMQDQNVACHRTCAWPSRNLASTRGDGKCRINAHEIHTCLYNMTII